MSDHLEVSVADLADLIEWLAMPYGDNEPVFATALPDGRPLDAGIRLQRIWRAVMGEGRRSDGAWVMCDACGRPWYVHAGHPSRNLTDHEVEQLRRSLTAR